MSTTNLSNTLHEMRVRIAPVARRFGLTNKYGSDLDLFELRHLEAQLDLRAYAVQAGIPFRIAEIYAAITAADLADLRKEFRRRKEEAVAIASMRSQAKFLEIPSEQVEAALAKGIGHLKRLLAETRAGLTAEATAKKRRADNHRHAMLVVLRRQAKAVGIPDEEVTQLLIKRCQAGDYSPLVVAIEAATKAQQEVALAA